TRPARGGCSPRARTCSRPTRRSCTRARRGRARSTGSSRGAERPSAAPALGAPVPQRVAVPGLESERRQTEEERGLPGSAGLLAGVDDEAPAGPHVLTHTPAEPGVLGAVRVGQRSVVLRVHRPLDLDADRGVALEPHGEPAGRPRRRTPPPEQRRAPAEHPAVGLGVERRAELLLDVGDRGRAGEPVPRGPASFGERAEVGAPAQWTGISTHSPSLGSRWYSSGFARSSAGSETPCCTAILALVSTATPPLRSATASVRWWDVPGTVSPVV